MTTIESNRMKELIRILNEASESYYAKDIEIMSNYEYDALYDELVGLEERTGVTLSDSPTVNVGYEAASFLPKERHASPMLSLAKTKERTELQEWLGNQDGLLSWKLDGLTIVLTYEGGELKKAVTRGNGEIGEVITQNAMCFKNIPHRISFGGELILRGEAVISYDDFENINKTIEDVDSKYKNPRNLCSGSVRALDPKITKERNVKFIAFSLVSAENVDFSNSVENKFNFLEELGFDVVAYKRVSRVDIIEAIEAFEKELQTNEFPSDGLVLCYDDILYGESLGRTAKFPRNAIAFKWADETALTKLIDIEWSASRTGLINPVAIFESVELEGTTVSRASVHNISIVKNLMLGLGDTISVYKANMIIPQIAENLTKSNTLVIPKQCPVCGGQTEIRNISDSESLYCTNPDCMAKQIKSYTLFVSRDAMNIEGLSEQTLEKFIAKGFIKQMRDIFHLQDYKNEIESMEGFGEKSFENLISSIEKAKQTTLHRFIYALGIPGVGVANAKLLSRSFDKCYDKLKNATVEELATIDGIGEIIAGDIVRFFGDANRLMMSDSVYDELDFSEDRVELKSNNTLEGKTFVITGAVYKFANRSELKEYIEAHGGKTTGSVTSKTDYLINNDSTSTSSKNKKANELGVKIITEDEFMSMCE